jgi:PTS system nitrogen regulatory IIA component
MVALAEESGLVASPRDLLTKLEEREKICATALEGGVALLHPAVHDPHLFLDSLVFLGRTIQPIPFGAPDGSVTDLFFLVCCRDGRLHLHVLARLCMMCLHTDLLAGLRAAPDAAALHAQIRRCEEAVLKTTRR